MGLFFLISRVRLGIGKAGVRLTQKTSYMSSPTSSRVDTLRLGSLTSAINATHRPMPRAASRKESGFNSNHIHVFIHFFIYYKLLINLYLL